MLIKIFGSTPESQKLYDITLESLETLGLSDFVGVERTSEDSYKKELNITSEPAFCVEEDTIEFKDVIFEGSVPEKPELDSLLISLIGGSDEHGCGDGCSGCSGSCHI